MRARTVSALVLAGVISACALVTRLDDLGADGGSGTPDATPDTTFEATTPQADSGADADADDASVDVDPLSLVSTGSLVLWLEAKPTTVNALSGRVTSWQDQSGKQNAAFNTVNNGPLVASGVVNGHDAVYFDSRGVTLDIPDSTSLRFATDALFVVALVRQTTAGAVYFFSKGTTRNSGGGVLFSDGFELYAQSTTLDSGAGPFIFPFTVLSSDGGTVESILDWNAPVFDDGKFHVVAFERRSPSLAAMWVDGKSATFATLPIDVSMVDAGAKLGAIGYGNLAPTTTGDLAELVIVHGSALNASVVMGLQSHFKTKYAL